VVLHQVGNHIVLLHVHTNRRAIVVHQVQGVIRSLRVHPAAVVLQPGQAAHQGAEVQERDQVQVPARGLRARGVIPGDKNV